jgi:peptidoglycan/LPS O-acetylase OafA/YrhL
MLPNTDYRYRTVITFATFMKNRNFGLDLVRAISIWLVLLQHTGISPFGLKIGNIGVDVFFVLSGFLIGEILIRDISRENSFATLKKFWIRRWFRILPVYYLALAVKFIFFDHSIGWNILYYVFFLQNHFYGIQYYSVTWSLVIEEWFYLTAPLYIMAAYTIFKKQTIRRLLFSLLAFIVLVNIGRFIYVSVKNVPFEGVNGNVPFRLDSLFCGVIIAFLKLEIPALFRKLTSGIYFLIGLSIFLSYTIYLGWLASHPPARDIQVFPRTFGLFVLSASIALMIPAIQGLTLNPLRNIVNKSVYQFVTMTSLLTYSIYLVHPFVFPYFLENPVKPGSGMWFAETFGAIFLTYAIAWLIYRFYEKPVLQLREKFA